MRVALCVLLLACIFHAVVMTAPRYPYCRSGLVVRERCKTLAILFNSGNVVSADCVSVYNDWSYGGGRRGRGGRHLNSYL